MLSCRRRGLGKYRLSSTGTDSSCDRNRNEVWASTANSVHLGKELEFADDLVCAQTVKGNLKDCVYDLLHRLVASGGVSASGPLGGTYRDLSPSTPSPV